MINSNKRR